MTPARWGKPRLRRLLCPPNRLVLDPWVTRACEALQGLVVNVGAGEDLRQFGRRTIHVDAFAPLPTVRADLTGGLPFRSAVFDSAICTEVIEHVPDERVLLAELARVLKPGGTLVLTVPFMYRYHPDPADYRRLTPDGLRLLLEHAGFSVTLSTGLGGWWLALLLWIDGAHMVSRVALRMVLVPLRPFFRLAARPSTHPSTFAANSVAIATRNPT